MSPHIPSSRALAPHVRAALASAAQAKPAGTPAPRAAHVQAALAAAQAKLPVGKTRAAAHVAAAVSRPEPGPVIRSRTLPPIRPAAVRAIQCSAPAPSPAPASAAAAVAAAAAAAAAPAAAVAPAAPAAPAAPVGVDAKGLSEFELAARKQNSAAEGAQNALLRIILVHDEGDRMLEMNFTHTYSLHAPGRHSESEVVGQAVAWLMANAEDLRLYTLRRVELFTRKNPCPECSQSLCTIAETLGKVVGVSGGLDRILSYTDALYIPPGAAETVAKWTAIKAQNDAALQKSGWTIRQVLGFR
jgi:tRNA(Arg) A34 adenosine deaminase TadA